MAWKPKRTVVADPPALGTKIASVPLQHLGEDLIGSRGQTIYKQVIEAGCYCRRG